jgi:hypothetical protein
VCGVEKDTVIIISLSRYYRPITVLGWSYPLRTLSLHQRNIPVPHCKSNFLTVFNAFFQKNKSDKFQIKAWLQIEF